MRMENIEGREAVVRLTAEDCMRLAMACGMAANDVHGKLSPDEAERADAWLESVGTLFEVAAMAAAAWSHMSIKHAEYFTLAKIREGATIEGSAMLDPIW